MRVYVAMMYEEYCGYQIAKVFSDFDKAKDFLRPQIQEVYEDNNWDKDTLAEIMNDFEEYGYVEEMCKIEDYEVD